MSHPGYFLDTTDFGINIQLPIIFTFYSFGFPIKHQVIIAPEYSNNDVIFFSWDGINVAGRLNPQDASLNIVKKNNVGIWLKGNSVNQNVRVWGQ